VAGRILSRVLVGLPVRATEMKNLVSAIMLVALMGGPVGRQTVYQNNDVCYPVFEVNAQTEKKPATSAEQAGAIATFAGTGTGTMVEVAAGLYNVLVNHTAPVARPASTPDRACRKNNPPQT
jgi:hypothetical protein